MDTLRELRAAADFVLPAAQGYAVYTDGPRTDEIGAAHTRRDGARREGAPTVLGQRSTAGRQPQTVNCPVAPIGLVVVVDTVAGFHKAVCQRSCATDGVRDAFHDGMTSASRFSAAGSGTCGAVIRTIGPSGRR